jgi:acetyl esterase/lipase
MTNLVSKVLPIFSKVISPKWDVQKNVQYGKTKEEVADLYLLSEGVHPAIIFIHGGGWSAGDKSAYEGRAKKYALAGFHVIAINYRLAKMNDSTSQWNAQLQDVQLAVRWVKANAIAFRIDPNKIAVGGDSAGAHLSLFLGSLDKTMQGDRHSLHANQSPKVCAVVDMFGPCDLSTPEMQKVVMTTPLFGGKEYDKHAALYFAASPINTLNASTSPTFIAHGTSDTVVPYSQSVLLCKKLTGLGVHHKFVTFDGGHELEKISWFTQMMLELKGLWFIIDVVKG